MKLYSTFANSILLHVINTLILLTISWILFGDLFINYFDAEIVGGWDGTSHYAITKYYAQNIFPEIYGWVPNYYAGMPFPLFYPPLFYFVVAAISNIATISVAAVFKFILVFCTLTFPIIIYRASYYISFSKLSAFIAGLFTIILLGLGEHQGGSLGISIPATFNSGLVTQSVGGWLFFLWLPYLLKLDWKNYNLLFLKSVMLLSLVLLSNAHVVQVTFLIFITIGIVDIIIHKKNKFKSFLFWLIHGLFAVGLVAFWYLPFLHHYNYSTTKTMSLSFFGSLETGLWFVILLGLVLLIYLRKKISSIQIKVIFACIALLFFVLPLDKILPGLPIQASRNIPFLFLMASFLSAHGFSLFIKDIKILLWKKIIIITASVFLLIQYIVIPYSFMGTYPKSSTNIEEIVEILSNDDTGRSLVEVVTTVHPKRIIHDPYSTISSNDREDNLKNNRIIHPIFENIKIPNHLIYDDNIEYLPDHYVLAALLGSESLHKTIWTVFRESSIHSLFIPTLRNIFSLRGEDFGVVCYLCTELNSDYFNTETPLRKIMRSDMYNVKYFIFFNRPEIARVLDLKDYLRPLLVSDTWNIYERTEKIYYAQILPYYPSVIFTDFNTKDRKKDGIDSLNWMRIQEEWFRIGNFDQAMVYPNSILIDELETPENYSSIVLFDYKYNSQDKALSLIKKYIENDGHVILYPSRDPIYRKLTLINHPNIHLMNYLGFSDIDIEALLNKLNIYKKEVATEITIIDTQINNNEINIILDNNSNTILPIRISSTYFPLWKHIDGQPVMMTSPVFSLFFTNTSENIIEFKKNNYDLWGRNISLIFLIFLIILFLEKIIPIRKIYEKYNSTN